MDTERIRSLLEEAERILDPVRDKVSAAYGDIEYLVNNPGRIEPGVGFEIYISGLNRNLRMYSQTLPEAGKAREALTDILNELKEYNQLTKE